MTSISGPQDLKVPDAGQRPRLAADVAPHRWGVTFALDRAGMTGDDGASHNGVGDLV